MVDLNNTYWERLFGYVSELRVDARWVLRSDVTKKSLGSLRIVSHPDLKPGHLRAIFTYVIDIKEKTNNEKLKTTVDHEISLDELEIYSVDNHIETESKTYENPFKELESMFGVKIFV